MKAVAVVLAIVVSSALVGCKKRAPSQTQELRHSKSVTVRPWIHWSYKDGEEQPFVTLTKPDEISALVDRMDLKTVEACMCANRHQLTFKLKDGHKSVVNSAGHSWEFHTKPGLYSGERLSAYLEQLFRRKYRK